MIKLLLRIYAALKDIYYAFQEYSYDEVLKRLNQQIRFLSHTIRDGEQVNPEDAKWLLTLLADREKHIQELGCTHHLQNRIPVKL